MSMFYELMMRKKEETLYPVIKGSLTESPEGVFSGFSANDYLQDSNFFDVANATSFESVIKFTTGSTVAQQQGGAGIGFSYFGFYINSVGNLKAPVTCVKSGSNTSFDPTILTGLSANTTYWVKVVFANGTITWKTSTDGINWNTSTTNTIDSLRLPGSSVFVVGKTSHGVFNGSIDLNNTYYIINGTKYNLQAVVGYTIVGSPTIVDGVVTDFSASNYLQLPTINTLPNNFEFGVAFTTNTVKAVRIIGTGGAGSIATNIAILGSSAHPIQINIANSSKSFSVTSSVSYITGQKYYVKGYQKGTILGIKVSTDNINWTTTEKEIDEGFTTTLATVLYLGINKYSNNYLEGSLDLNYTYIKLDNKLWFNGQQA